MLLLTFIAYAAFHMGRRPLSVVKNVLNHECSKSALTDGPHHFDNGTKIDDRLHYSTLNNNTDCDWAPFNDNRTANHLLAYLDTAFLLSYAICMFGSGFIAERMNLRYFITLGSVLSGVGLIAFGMAYSLGTHSMAYFVLIQTISGAVQSID